MHAAGDSILTLGSSDPLLRATATDLKRLRLLLVDLDRTIEGGKPDRGSPLGSVWSKLDRLNLLMRQMGFQHPLLSMSTVCLWPMRPGLKESDTFCLVELFNQAGQCGEDALFRGDESPADILEFRDRVLEAVRSWVTDIDVRITELSAQWREDQVSPYPDGTDERYLWGWAYRMDCYIRSGLSLSPLSSALVLPDPRSAGAINRLSIRYPAIIRQIQDHLDMAKRCLDRIGDDEISQDQLREAMWVLKERIYAGAATIAQAEGEADQSEHAPSMVIVRSSRMSSEEATKRLLALRLQGLRYTSQPRLAAQIGCGVATVNKAIRGSSELQSWMQQTRAPQGAPKAISLASAPLADSCAAAADDPTDLLPPEDVQKILDRLISEHGDGMRRHVDSLDPDARRKLAATYEEQRLDAEESSLAPRVSGRRGTETRVHKRV